MHLIQLEKVSTQKVMKMRTLDLLITLQFQTYYKVRTTLLPKLRVTAKFLTSNFGVPERQIDFNCLHPGGFFLN